LTRNSCHTQRRFLFSSASSFNKKRKRNDTTHIKDGAAGHVGSLSFASIFFFFFFFYTQFLINIKEEEEGRRRVSTLWANKRMMALLLNYLTPIRSFNSTLALSFSTAIRRLKLFPNYNKKS
jgi:hypothetical protein